MVIADDLESRECGRVARYRSRRRNASMSHAVSSALDGSLSKQTARALCVAGHDLFQAHPAAAASADRHGAGRRVSWTSRGSRPTAVAAGLARRPGRCITVALIAGPERMMGALVSRTWWPRRRSCLTFRI